MRRLYIGGLSQSVTEKDLKDRFGKFGDVQDVEIRTRKDDEGIPYKTFGYININISEADLKKCLTVLNKSKWKGGTLQIETAKESFLHRLAQERQAAVEQCLQNPAAEDKRQKLLDSLSKAGVDNFTMKAAVPGTEIPGHKDWVVSKFGRVLPILQLRCQKGNRGRTVKYDPSKYSHNIRKLDRTITEQPVTPVTQLTWEVQGGDDDISRKRRGEFPPYEPSRPKKSRSHRINSYNPEGKNRFEQSHQPLNCNETHQLTNGFEANLSPAQRSRAHFNDSDVDSDEEIRRLVAAQQTSHGALRQECEDENLEVVGLDYLVKLGMKGRPDAEEEDDYDSADTDELFASRKPPPPPPKDKLTPSSAESLSENSTNDKRKAKKSKGGEKDEEKCSSDAEEHSIPRTPSSTQQRGESGKQSSQKKSNSTDNPSQKRKVLPFSESDDDDDEDEELESADSCSDSDYEAMFSNVTHLEISMADLQRLAEESQQTSDNTAPSILSTGPKQDTNLTSGPAEQRAPKKGTLPEEILAAIMEEDSSEDEQRKKRKGVKSVPLPAFKGTRVLKEPTDESLKRQTEENDEKKQKLGSESLKLSLNREKCTKTKKMLEITEEDEEEEDKKEGVMKNIAATKHLKIFPNKVPVNNETAETSSFSSCDEEEKERMEACQTVLTNKAAAIASSSSSSSSSEEDDEKQETVSSATDSESSSSSEDEEQAPPQLLFKAEDEEERQRKANMRRLAAVQQRQKEAEEHKKLIQGALANLDTPKAGGGKHVVFGSDDEDKDEQHTTSEVSTLKKTLFHDSQSEDESRDDEASVNENSRVKEKVRLKPSGPQLFDGSEGEDDSDEEEDGGRFDIRPQFEGRAGQKLMELQSRFGTDERFRIDSRFLEEDKKEEKESERKSSLNEEDKTLEEERKKNMEILQSILGSSQQTSIKTASKAKTFRDVAALHYDPSKEEHTVFESKTEETKESKSARRKKREEAQTLPEVSKEIYYEVSGDLKAVFGPTKSDMTGGEEKTSWDQEEEVEEDVEDEEPTQLSSLFSADPSEVKEELTGFKFSFFGDDIERQSVETEYKVESIQAPKVSWKQDPRFHDSSSEEDEEEQEEDEEETNPATKTTEEETPSKVDLFFFYPEDSRLTEGPRLFCCLSQLEEQREQWEERRNALRQEYRKKHKDARRKLKSSQKS
ncbi:nucleolar protein 8 isoform X2 [Channa argus]|uniref:nucleolar protein 8 isoform X2 n=1 Tax=Channa argus TaxID=215402 RepID=UPI00351FB03D